MGRSSADSPFRALPSADRVLRDPSVVELTATFERGAVVRLVRRVLAESRVRIEGGESAPGLDDVVERVVRRVRSEWTASPRPVINATGVILHTNLGRAPLSRDAVEAASRVAAYSDLEYNLEDGERGSRQHHVQRLLLGLFDAEAAHVAVNSAAGVLLALTALARGKEVILSRGQSVEIGGGFRVPVIMRQSGARLVEVGTTNRTRPRDYEEAITERTAALLHVHSSNFRVVGFTEQVELAELATLAQRQNLLLIDDNGSGSLYDTARFGLAHEPMPRESLEAGADVVVFSGDKLLGGPQAGIVVGRSDPIKRMASHPLARAMRPDKAALASLAATLLAYLRGDAANTLPLWRMIAGTGEEIAMRAQGWADAAARRGLSVTLEAGESTVGGGSLPGETLPTVLVCLPRSISAAALRRASPPVIARTRGQRVMLDLRTVPEEDEMLLLDLAVAAMDSVDRQKRAMLDSST